MLQTPVINFAQPSWILAGLLCCLGAIFFLRLSGRQRQERLARFAAPPLLGRLTENVSSRRRLLKKGLWLAALFCCFLALARPQYGFKMVEVKRKGIDILFALDTSRSMLTEDIRPDRLTRARLAIIDFINQLEGDRVGLLPFAGTAFLMCPLTIDYNAFENTLAAVNTAIIPRGGTNLAAAIDLAVSSLAGDNNHKILILLTDGENLEGDALAAAKKGAASGMTIYTVGVGTPDGELIPLPDQGPGHFLKDEAGRFITSRLDEAALAAIAEAAGGIYVPLGKNGEGLEEIYQRKLRLIPKKELAEKLHQEPLERAGWPVGAALLLLAAEFVVSGRRSAHFLQKSFIKTAGRRIRQGLGGKPLLISLLISLAGLPPAQASRGEEAFAAGDFLGAAEFYDQALKKNPEDPRLHYNAGTAAYKNNLYDEAIASFQQALKSEDLGLQEQTYYNLGNALYKRGDELVQSNPGQAEKLWQQAMDAYSGSLHLNPGARDSEDNRQLVSRKLDELKKQQEQQQDQNGQEKEEQKQDQNQQTGDRQSQQDDQGQQNRDGQPGKKDDSGEQPSNDQPSSRPDQSSPSPEQSGEQPGGDEKQSTGNSAKENQQTADAGNAQEAGTNGDNQSREQSAAPRTAASNQPGRMTGEEAHQLLNRLKEEEGNLNFVPRTGPGKEEKEGKWKDW